METFFGQLLALVTFFAFPAIQYIILKRLSKKEGNPELWYLPSYGFRLVIRNIPRKRILSDLKCKTIIRKIEPANSGSSVSVFMDEILIDREDLFLFPNSDQILVSFKIEGGDENNLCFCQTDKLGKIVKTFPLSEFESVFSDYTLNIENLLNFDIKIAKRVEINTQCLTDLWKKVKANNTEAKYECSEIINIG